jgi:thioredoxin reductase
MIHDEVCMKYIRKSIQQGRITMKNTNQQVQGAFQQQQAVVIGGGKAGLLAARVLSEHFEQVTIIERQMVYANCPFMEEHVRKALMDRGNVRIIDNCDVTGIGVLDDQITGVYLRYREEEPFKKLFQTDFVVDASGSGSRAPQWLEFLGYGSVKESSVNLATEVPPKIATAEC